MLEGLYTSVYGLRSFCFYSFDYILDNCDCTLTLWKPIYNSTWFTPSRALQRRNRQLLLLGLFILMLECGDICKITIGLFSWWTILPMSQPCVPFPAALPEQLHLFAWLKCCWLCKELGVTGVNSRNSGRGLVATWEWVNIAPSVYCVWGPNPRSAHGDQASSLQILCQGWLSKTSWCEEEHWTSLVADVVAICISHPNASHRCHRWWDGQFLWCTW